MLKIAHPHIKSREVMMELQESDEWILNEGVRYMEDFNGSHDTMLEIGAHMGCSTLYFAAEKGFKRILAIEAFFENFRKLVTNTYSNHLGGIIAPMWAAVALKTGEARTLFWS